MDTPFQGSCQGYLHQNEHHTQMNFTCLNNMYCDRQLCDVILVADGKEIQAHKVILATCSAYFYFKFSEYRKLHWMNRIEIEKINYETLSAVIGYFYKSEILITEENLDSLLGAAYNLAVPDLQKACWNFMQLNLSPRNCFEIEDIAKRYQCEKLVPIVAAYIAENFSEVIKNEGYLKSTNDQLLDFICRDDLCATEDEVLECIVQWIRFDFQNRRDYVQSLISKVRLSLISPGIVLKIMEEQQWLKSDHHFLIRFINSHMSGEVFRPLISRSQLSKVLVVVGVNNDKYLSMEMYNFQNNNWSEGPEIMNIACDLSTVTIHDTKIYCMKDKIMRFIDMGNNAAQMVWSDCSHMSENKGDFSCLASFNNHIYKVGGRGDVYPRLAIAEKYDTLSGKWIRIANMSEGRDSMRLVAFDGNLYAVGGRTVNSRFSDLVEYYKQDTDSWCMTPAMPFGKDDPGVGVLGDSLFVVGGRTKDGICKKVESFNHVKGTWSRLPDMNVARLVPGVIAVNGHLFVIGGKDSNGSLDSVEIYNPKSNTWSMLPCSLKSGKNYVAASLIDRSSIKFY